MSETPGEALEQLRAMANLPTSQARFVCARHGTEAGVVKLYRHLAEDSSLVIESFAGRDWHRIPLPDADTSGDPVAEALQDALARADAIGLLLLDPSWAPFYCVECQKSYCGECWRTWEVFDDDFPDWVDQVRGVCPEGHERMLSD
jgi:hypothetical protein